MNKKVLISSIIFSVLIVAFIALVSSHSKSEKPVSKYSLSLNEYISLSSNYLFNERLVNTNKIRKAYAEATNGKGDESLYYIYNAFLEKQYVLCESNDSYLIYDLMLEDIMEFSLKSPSIWKCKDIKYDSNILIYSGPTYIYYSSNGLVKDAVNDETVGTITNNNVTYKTEKVVETENTLLTDMVGKTIFGTTILNDIRVKYSYYFENFYLPCEYNATPIDPNDFDAGNSCEIVALDIILGYYDTFYNDYIIPEQIAYYKDNHTNVINTTIKTPYTSHDFENWKPFTSSQNISPTGPTQDFHNYLCYLAEQYGYYSPSNGMNTSNIPNLLNHYPAIEDINFSSSYSLLVSPLDLIDNNQPFILGLAFADGYSYNLQNGNPSLEYSNCDNHAVVCYGYLTANDNSNYYTCHIGYSSGSNSQNYTIFSETFIKPVFGTEIAYFEYSGSHIPSGNYLISKNDNNYSFCPCDNPSCTHNREYIIHTNYYYSYSGIDHTLHCYDCFHTYTESHNLVLSTTQMTHTYSCSCGYSNTEYHNFVQVGRRQVCTICGYSTLDPIIVPINGEVDDEN